MAGNKASYIGAPVHHKLELACQSLQRAFPEGQCYLVGSALDRPDWRDIDISMIFDDADFAAMFPGWELNNFFFLPRWLLLVTWASEWLSAQTGLPVDFKMQPRSHANSIHKGRRDAIGLIFASAEIGDENG